MKAVVLQGVDAAAGVTSQADPKPVLLRTLSQGTLPGHHHSHLSQCFVVGAGFGDVSSERVYVRLENLSCAQQGKLVSFPVSGYVAGTDAKTGQHGPVRFRAKPFLTRAFWGGFFSGLGHLGNSVAMPSHTPGTMMSMNPTTVPLAATSSGMSSAADLYAQYNIHRAEQYQPVVALNAGQVVDIVFTKGFWLAGNPPINPEKQSSSIPSVSSLVTKDQNADHNHSSQDQFIIPVEEGYHDA